MTNKRTKKTHPLWLVNVGETVRVGADKIHSARQIMLARKAEGVKFYTARDLGGMKITRIA